jgi:hypothetical protein
VAKRSGYFSERYLQRLSKGIILWTFEHKYSIFKYG